jgi:mono/diheme cytochrome c family protein
MKFGFAVLLLILVATSTVFASSVDRRTHGAEVFAANGCGHCHRMNNAGGHKGPDLSGVGRKLSKTRIREQILQGGNEMPSFMDDLERSEVDDLVVYLRSCREKPAKK